MDRSGLSLQLPPGGGRQLPRRRLPALRPFTDAGDQRLHRECRDRNVRNASFEGHVVNGVPDADRFCQPPRIDALALGGGEDREDLQLVSDENLGAISQGHRVERGRIELTRDQSIDSGSGHEPILPERTDTVSPRVSFETGGMNEEHETPHGLEPLLNINELAGYLGVPVSTIYDWRTGGKGPCGYRFGKRIMFGVTDIRDWMDTMRDPINAMPGAASFRGGEEVARG